MKQSKRELADTIEKIKTRIEMVSFETFSLDEIAAELPRTNKIDEKVHSKFLADFADNRAIQSQVREVSIPFTEKIYELISSYTAILDSEHENVPEEDSDIHSDDHDLINPAHIGIEICFGIMKFFEDRFKSLTFEAL